ncbi:DUF3857 domain-containing protein [Saccharicrinis sp. FJH54]|uniref:DUF3857 domain-containing protein n=1 Tax=Saccharicrinis sp. FJH54 TaxID=3344665 RepID=UPI0035D458C8
MNHLFSKLKTKFKLLILVSVCLISSVSTLASDSISDESFRIYTEKADAYYKYSYTDISYIKNWNRYKKYTSNKSKLIINSRKGVDEYSFIRLNKIARNHLEKFGIRTLKADGSIVELDSALFFKHKKSIDNTDLISYPIPGVEPGDTIEFNYIFWETVSASQLRGFVNLYSEIPSLTTEYTLKTSPELIVRYKTYNGFPDPMTIANDTLIYCVFKMENIPGIVENQYTCLPCELPYLYYAVDKKDDELKTWKDVYNTEFNFITQPILLDYENSTYYKRWKRRVIGDAQDSSKFFQFKLLIDELNRNYTIEPTTEDEFIKSSGYFLKEKHFDPISIRRMYRQLLEDLDINYWAVFARDKRSGVLDPYYLRKGEYEHIFFGFENNDGSLSLLYPPNESFKYQIDEIPTSIYNTVAVLVKPYKYEIKKKSDQFINYDLKMAEVDSVITQIVKLPGFSPGSNNSKLIYYCDVDPITKTSTFKSNVSVSGGLSTDIRSFITMLYQDEDAKDFYNAYNEYEGNESAFEIDTVLETDLKSTRPFTFKFCAEGTVKNNITFINDSIISITLEDLIQHSLIESKQDSMDLNYYLDYTFTDLFLLVLNFPVKIELLGNESIEKEIHNNFGEYIFKLNIVNNNQLVLQSHYKIFRDLIPKEDYEQLKVLNKLVQDVKNMRIMITTKPNS